MSNRICNSKSQPYWRDPDWHPTHMTFKWFEREMRAYSSSPPLPIPRSVRRLNDKLRKMARQSRKINRQGRR